MEDPIADDREGFICPFCLVGFASTQSLSRHFLTFHNEGNDGQPLINVGEVSCLIYLSSTLNSAVLLGDATLLGFTAMCCIHSLPFRVIFTRYCTCGVVCNASIRI